MGGADAIRAPLADDRAASCTDAFAAAIGCAQNDASDIMVNACA